MSRRFYFVDVFAGEPLAGNPLSLVPDADGIDEPTMRKIAREFNQAETTFLLAPTAAGATWRLRSFTPPGAEVFGAGHNALGAWLWLAASGRLPLDGGRGEFFQQLGDRVLPVQVAPGEGGASRIVMTQAPPEFRAQVDDRFALAHALGLADEDVLPGAQVVSTGAAHLLVPVRDRAAVDRARPEPGRLAASLADVGGEGCYLFSRETVTPDAAAYTRFFNPTVGIVEDPATGSAAGPLACQLVAHGWAADGSPLGIEQGHVMGRPSRIEVTVRGDEVRVAGSGVVTAEGTLALP